MQAWRCTNAYALHLSNRVVVIPRLRVGFVIHSLFLMRMRTSNSQYRKVVQEASVRMGPAIHVHKIDDVSEGEDADVSGLEAGQPVEVR